MDNDPFYYLFEDWEVWEQLGRIKEKMATGPDRISVTDLKRMDPGGRQLACLLNVWLVTGCIPEVVKQCRSVLIPKVNDELDLKEVGDWIPITLARWWCIYFLDCWLVDWKRAINLRQKVLQSPLIVQIIWKLLNQ